MTLRSFTVFFWGCLVATAAVAGPDHKTKIEVVVDGDETGHRVIRLDGENSDFNFRDLEVGESQTIKDSDGNDVTVLRTDGGFEFDIEGETITIGGLHDDDEMMMLRKGHGDEEVIIEKHKQVRIFKTSDTDGVTIISGDEIDDATRAALKKVLKDAGRDGEVLFIDGSELRGDEQAHGVRKVEIIRKEFDVTN